MATKPTKITDWATDGAALTAATDLTKHDLGWQTLPDNQPGQVGERPNLEMQNYWQLAVHEWQQYFETATDEIIAQLPDNTVTTELDLWEWDLDTVDDINNEVNDLVFFSGSFDSGTNWDSDNQSDGCFIGYWYETMYNFRQGVSLRLIDAADVVWLISPVAGVKDFFTETVTISGGAENGSTKLRLLPNAKIEIRKDDVIVADFSTFTSLADRTAIDTKNPTGLRAISREVSDIAVSRGVNGLNRPYKRKRWRSLIGSGFNILTGGVNAFFTTKLVTNQMYKIKIVIFKANATTASIFLQSDITSIQATDARLGWLTDNPTLAVGSGGMAIPQYYEADFRSADDNGIGFFMSGTLTMVNLTMGGTGGSNNFNIADFMTDARSHSMFTIEEMV